MTFRVTKDPQAVLDYSVDWAWPPAPWLVDGDSVVDHAVTAVGLTVDSTSRSGAVVTAWLSGGTPGAVHEVTYEVTTASGRKDQRTVNVYVAER